DLVAVGFADDGSQLPPATRRIGLARFVAEQLDVKRKPGRAPDALVIALWPHYSHLFPRILLLCDQPRVYVIAGRRNPLAATGGALRHLASARYDIEPGAQVGSVGFYRAIARPPQADDRVAQTLRRWTQRRKSQVRNGLVKALIGVAGASLTQNQARSLLDGRSAIQRYGSARLWDVPEHGLAALVDDVAAICRQTLPLPTGQENPR
ncbi:MAG TPA: hypothetical protein VFK80_07925, partial [Limnochordia bacterium]|nr:hypothetical protein [Limnochordia bacterium]